ncbi:hypothetical protein L6452_26375 [Arctium lappa]|uniref:Uncharacterized protein n=1 Tax=Arctium lappa TaxID=4217 RepID=A0ACB9ADD5_ARCLA|nr:hypothetical protein L6452_26375 [Arctium lappa]
MELVLEAKDWIYKGEGAVNLVLSYTGTSPNLMGKVLRVQKVKRKESEYEKALSKHEYLVWKETGGGDVFLSASTKDIANHIYVQQVMCPLLGSQHIDAGVRVEVTREFLESIHNAVLFQRPCWRAENARVNTQSHSAILMSDHSIFPHGGVHEQQQQLCIAVEIKPKCGFLPISRFIREENAAKKRISRFKLHQILKFHQRKISQISEYDPLDMFSASKERVLKSVKDLFLTPQNNFRVFLNGSLVFGSLGGGAEDTDTRIAQAFEDTLKDVIQADEGMRTPNFLQLVAEAVSESGVMDRLLQVQKLDVFDVEGAIHAYYDVVSQPCVVCRDLGEAKLLNRYESLHSLRIDESLKIVRDFLISATAKDLSLMISFRASGKGNLASPYDVVFLESINQSFDYKASFIDLDMKPLERMAYYYKLDQEIVGCYSRMMETVNRPGKSSLVQLETTYCDQSAAIEDTSSA